MHSLWSPERQVREEVSSLSNEIVVRNGFVFDPANGIDGDRMDVFVRDGRIVEKVDEDTAKKIDALGMLVMAGGVDIHNLA